MEEQADMLFLHCSRCGGGLMEAVVTKEGLSLLCSDCQKISIIITDIPKLVEEVLGKGCDCCNE